MIIIIIDFFKFIYLFTTTAQRLIIKQELATKEKTRGLKIDKARQSR
jgi:hypothetical protein